MGETSLSDLDPEQLRELLSIAEEPEARDSGEETASSCPSRSIDMPPQQLGSWIDRYKLVEYLGEGGMAIVYLGEQEYPVRRTVALKLIKPGMDSKRVIARFEAERQALALLSHPNIAQIHDAGTTESGRPYFVMEYIKGLSITEHCDHHKLTIEERLNLFRQVCLAVHHAHQKGIIHRDIKPSNILISAQDGQFIPKIIDFGVAKAIAQPLTERTLVTERGQLFGTPEYMSPEQADMANEDIDTRSNIFGRSSAKPIQKLQARDCQVWVSRPRKSLKPAEWKSQHWPSACIKSSNGFPSKRYERSEPNAIGPPPNLQTTLIIT